MKSIIFRHSRVLSIFVMCVLAFSVQGVAEAVTDPAIEDTTLNPTMVYDVGHSTITISFTCAFDKPGTTETVSISKSSGVLLTGRTFTD